MAALSALPIMEPSSAFEFMSNFKAKLMFPRLNNNKKKIECLLFPSCTLVDILSHANYGNIPLRQYGFVSVCVFLTSFSVGKRPEKYHLEQGS